MQRTGRSYLRRVGERSSALRQAPSAPRYRGVSAGSAPGQAPGQRGYAGNRATSDDTASRTSASAFLPFSPVSSAVAARAMSWAIGGISAVVMPCVVIDGEPTRMPDAVIGGCGSYG